ncbi:RNA-guided endonuclease TnpB family protein, partial [Aerococcus viridans]
MSEIDSSDETNIQRIVGIDRGLRQILTIADDTAHTTFYSGKSLMKKRRRFKRLRQSLQAKNTKSSRRRLRTIERRENRWMNDVNHQLSKTLVDRYGANTLFVLEDLTNVTFNTTHHRKQDARYEHHSWRFFDFEEKLMYKALESGSQVLKVSAQFTSQ